MQQKIEGNQEVLAQLKGQIMALEYATEIKKALQELVEEETEDASNNINRD